MAREGTGSERAKDAELLASAAMERIVHDLAEEAEQQVRSPAASEAFEVWASTASAATGAPDDVIVFASEAAFAAAARIALRTHLRIGAGAALESAFPHLFSSPLFVWFEPDPETARRLGDAMREIPSAVSPVAVLGWLYQFAIPEETRKRFGHFYTRPEIVDSMLDSVGFSGPGILGKRWIDPAVGAGAFAIGATRRIIVAAEGHGMSGTDVYRAVQAAIHGLDLNPLGILLTEAAIALLLAPYLRGAGDVELDPLHLYITDSLTREDGEYGDSDRRLVEEIKSRRGDYADGFDFVAANPPYAKWPSRLLTERQKERFAKTLHGHPNLYGLFLQVGVELLADGGRLAFINPKSFVSGLYFRNLRRFLSEELDLTRFDTFDRRTGLFDGVLQDVVILTGQKRASRSATVELREWAGPPNGKPARRVEAPRDSVLLDQRFDNAFFVSADELAHRLLAKMANGSVALRDVGVKAATGTIVWNRLKGHMRDEAGVGSLPLVWGNAIRPFKFIGLGNRAGAATHVQVDAKTQGIKVKGAALLVKRMTAKEEPRRIVACQTPAFLAKADEGWFAENHVNVVTLTDDARISLDAVLGLLNSDLYDYVFRSLNGNTQVSASELGMLPVKLGPGLSEIVRCTRKLTAANGDAPVWRDRLEEAVADLFGISDQDRRALRTFYRPAVEAA